MLRHSHEAAVMDIKRDSSDLKNNILQALLAFLVSHQFNTFSIVIADSCASHACFNTGTLKVHCVILHDVPGHLE